LIRVTRVSHVFAHLWLQAPARMFEQQNLFSDAANSDAT
jgi:hypothetical protein